MTKRKENKKKIGKARSANELICPLHLDRKSRETPKKLCGSAESTKNPPVPPPLPRLLYNLDIIRIFFSTICFFHRFRLCNLCSPMSNTVIARYCCSCRFALLTGCPASVALFPLPHPFTRICLCSISHWLARGVMLPSERPSGRNSCHSWGKGRV